MKRMFMALMLMLLVGVSSGYSSTSVRAEDQKENVVLSIDDMVSQNVIVAVADVAVLDINAVVLPVSAADDIKTGVEVDKITSQFSNVGRVLEPDLYRAGQKHYNKSTTLEATVFYPLNYRNARDGLNFTGNI